MKSPPRRDETRNRPSLHLAEVLDFRPDQGVIRLHEQRVVILSAAALGLMRKELVDTLGLDTARRVLLRFGFADGYLGRHGVETVASPQCSAFLSSRHS